MKVFILELTSTVTDIILTLETFQDKRHQTSRIEYAHIETLDSTEQESLLFIPSILCTWK